MIADALERRSENVAFVSAPAEALPFSNGLFDAVTAFSALHWFANAAALSEIYRVLKQEGTFAVINKFDEGDAKERFRALVQSMTGHEIQNPKNDFDPITLVEGAGFRIQCALSVPYTEEFDPDAAKQYFMSTSISSALDEIEAQPTTKRALERFFLSVLTDDGRYVRPLRAALILARKIT